MPLVTASRACVLFPELSFFNTIEAREGDGGNIQLFRTSRAPGSRLAQLSLDAVKKSVESALRRVVRAPFVRVARRPEDIGLVNPSARVPKGLTMPDGTIALFSDGAESVVDVFQAVFHEFFHRGTKVRFTNNADYITKLLAIASSDEVVRAEVAAWKKSETVNPSWLSTA